MTDEVFIQPPPEFDLEPSGDLPGPVEVPPIEVIPEYEPTPTFIEHPELTIHEPFTGELTVTPMAEEPPPEQPYEETPVYVHQVRNLTKYLNGQVDCEILHETLGWIPFTADPNDTAPATLDVFAYITEHAININTLPPSSSIAANTITVERTWRDGQLAIADLAIMKLQDNDPSATFNLNKWRTYRIALRNWPQNPNFPNPAFRPVYPH